jgi:hypothetical protein
LERRGERLSCHVDPDGDDSECERNALIRSEAP